MGGGTGDLAQPVKCLLCRHGLELGSSALDALDVKVGHGSGVPITLVLGSGGQVTSQSS